MSSLISELRKPENRLQVKDIGKADPEVLLQVLYKNGGNSKGILRNK